MEDGSLYLQDIKEDYEKLTEEDEDYREFLFEEPELNELAHIFLKSPWKYEQGFLVGKEYQPLKDSLKWNNFNLKTCTPILLEMSDIWCYNKNNKKNN